MNLQEQVVVDAAIAILNSKLQAPGAVMSSPEVVKQYIRLLLETEEREVFLVLFLNSQHGHIAAEKMFAGTIDQAAVYPREVARRALILNAVSVILAHNHPSGSVTPSRADEVLTTNLRRALDLFDIRVLDHIIVGKGSVLSFAETGRL